MAEKDLVIESLKAETTALTRENMRLQQLTQEKGQVQTQQQVIGGGGGGGVASKYLSAVGGNKATTAGIGGNVHIVGGIRPLSRTILTDKNTNI